MKIGLIIIISLIFSELATAQVKYDANWVFGSNARVDFSDTSDPVAKYEPCYSAEAVASISDSAGNLLFYITTPDSIPYLPFSIMDSSGNMIDNGDSINAFAVASNGASIIPVPEKQDEYYLFHLGVVFTEYSFYLIPMYTYIVYDSINAQFTVTKKNVILIDESVEQRMALVKHANGVDWWLFVLGGDRVWYSFLITTDSIQGPFYQQIGVEHHASSIGCMAFSTTGKYMADAIYDQNLVELFDFDRCSGLLSNCRPLYPVGIDSSTYGVEFSPDETKLYVTIANATSNISEIYQYHVAEDTSLMQKQLIWSTNSLPTFTGQLQIASDNKIYLGVFDRTPGHCCPYYPNSYYSMYNQYLWRINTPDSSGAACNFQPYALYLGDSSRSYDGLPNMPNFNLGPLQNSLWQSTVSNDTFICTNMDTPTKGVFISVDTMPGVTATWQSAPGISNINATEQLVNPSQSTWYYVTFTDTALQGTCNSRMDSVYVQVGICDTTGIQQVNYSTVNLKIFPDPAQSLVTIEWKPVNGKIRLFINDLLGRLIQEIDGEGINGKMELNISSLQDGLYIVKLFANGSANSGKLAVSR